MGEAIKSKISWLLAESASNVAVGLGVSIIHLEGIFIVIDIVGVFLIMSGEKTWGTRLTSMSILIYFLGRVLSQC